MWKSSGGVYITFSNLMKTVFSDCRAIWWKFGQPHPLHNLGETGVMTGRAQNGSKHSPEIGN